MRVLLVCGSRDWTDREVVRYWLRRIASRQGLGVLLVHGDNGYDDKGRSLSGKPLVYGQAHRGADRLAAEEWVQLGGEHRPYPADWTRHGKKAGPLRNRRMHEQARPDMGLAFHFEEYPGGGTGDMLGMLHAADVPAFVARSLAECRPYVPEPDLFAARKL